MFGKSVRVEWKQMDRYGRILGQVYVGKDHVNRSMVRDGFAWHFKRYNMDQKLAYAEVEAREAGRGLWADKEPVPPWEFRKAAREKSKQLGEEKDE